MSNEFRFPVTAAPDRPWVSIGKGGRGKWGEFPGPATADALWYSTPTYCFMGALAVPSGATNYIPEFPVAVRDTQTCSLIGLIIKTYAGTVTFKIQHNGSDVGGGSPYTWTTSTTLTEVTATACFPIEVANKDSFQPVITAVSGSPSGGTIAFILEHGLAAP